MTMKTTSSDTLAREKRVRDFFALADNWGYRRYGEYLSEDVLCVFGNAEPIHGLADLLELSEQMESSLAGFSHDLKGIRQDIDGEHVTVEAEVTYTRKDGSQLTVPSAAVLRFGPAELIHEYRIYIDLSTLY